MSINGGKNNELNLKQSKNNPFCNDTDLNENINISINQPMNNINNNKNARNLNFNKNINFHQIFNPNVLNLNNTNNIIDKI